MSARIITARRFGWPSARAARNPGGIISSMIFKPHPHAEKRRQSIAKLIKVLLANQGPDILEKHVRDLLGTLLWKLTEADGKYKTRYQSSGSLACKDKSQLRHDHVYPRSKMIDALLTAKLEELDGILRSAVGCTVTLDEHLRLSQFDEEHAGWDRYRKAMVRVKDNETGEWQVSVDSN